MNLPSLCSLLASLVVISATPTLASPTYSTDPSGGVTTDLFDISQGSVVIQSSQVLPFGGEDIREGFGGNGGVESGNVMFADGAAIGAVDTVEWQTADFINLSAVQLRFSQDGGDPNRSTAAYHLFSTQDGVNYTSVSSGTVPLVGGSGTAMINSPLLINDSTLSGGTTNVRGFRLEVVRNSANGPRMVEVDGFGTAGVQTTNFLDRVLFNASTNSAYTGQSGDDQAPGSASGFASTPSVGGNSDDVTEVFGNANGPIEPGDFIFGDGGTADNGNGIFGDGGEFVDFISWHTNTPINLAGFRISTGGDGAAPDRETQLVRFLVEGVEVDLFDNNGFDGEVSRLFPGGTVTGDDFRIEFTRTTSAGGRVFEIDAITGVIPEPSCLLLVFLTGAFSLRRRR